MSIRLIFVMLKSVDRPVVVAAGAEDYQVFTECVPRYHNEQKLGVIFYSLLTMKSFALAIAPSLSQYNQFLAKLVSTLIHSSSPHTITLSVPFAILDTLLALLVGVRFVCCNM